MNKNYKLEFKNKQVIYKSSINNVVKLMDKYNLIAMDGLIYNDNDEIVGNIHKLNKKNREKLSIEDFKVMMIRDIMMILGSLQTNRLSQSEYSKKSYYKLKNKKLDKWRYK